MARVLLPVMRRNYNPNPRGSATSTVTMAANNPFESRMHVVNAIPGMSGLGDVAPVAPAAPAPAFNWAQLATGISQAGVQIGTGLATNAINQRYGQLPAQGAVPLPTSTSMMYAPRPASWLPYAIVGGAVVVGGAILLLMRGKKK
jgi:hypothetical protein